MPRTALLPLCLLGVLAACHQPPEGNTLPASPEVATSTPTPARVAQKAPQLWARVRASIGASASAAALNYDGEVAIESIGPTCEAEPVQVIAARSAKGSPAFGEDSSVSVTSATWCIPLAQHIAPAELWGTSISVRRVGHGELITGEEFTWLDPDELQSAGAYLYLPGRTGGYEISAYALAGRLQVDEQPYAQSAVAVKTRWVTQRPTDARHVLTLETFGQLPVALTVIVDGRAEERR